MQKVEEKIGLNAVVFTVTLRRASLTAIRRDDIALSVRRSISRLLGTIIDAVFMAAAAELSSGSLTVYDSRDRVNTVGNQFSNADDFVTFLTNSTANKASALSGGTAAASPKARRVSAQSLERAVEGKLVLHHGDDLLENEGGQRGLQLTLSTNSLSGETGDSDDERVRVAFNVLLPTLSAALQWTASPNALASNLSTVLAPAVKLILANLSTSPGGRVRRASVNSTNPAGNATNSSGSSAVQDDGGPLLVADVQLDASSLKTVTLIYKRTFWELVWKWILENIRNVIAGSCALILVITLMGVGKAWIASRNLKRKMWEKEFRERQVKRRLAEITSNSLKNPRNQDELIEEMSQLYPTLAKLAQSERRPQVWIDEDEDHHHVETTVLAFNASAPQRSPQTSPTSARSPMTAASDRSLSLLRSSRQISDVSPDAQYSGGDVVQRSSSVRMRSQNALQSINSSSSRTSQLALNASASSRALQSPTSTSPLSRAGGESLRSRTEDPDPDMFDRDSRYN
jgi:hypothetical protein